MELQSPPTAEIQIVQQQNVISSNLLNELKTINKFLELVNTKYNNVEKVFPLIDQFASIERSYSVTANTILSMQENIDNIKKEHLTLFQQYQQQLISQKNKSSKIDTDEQENKQRPQKSLKILQQLNDNLDAQLDFKRELVSRIKQLESNHETDNKVLSELTQKYTNLALIIENKELNTYLNTITDQISKITNEILEHKKKTDSDILLIKKDLLSEKTSHMLDISKLHDEITKNVLTSSNLNSQLSDKFSHKADTLHNNFNNIQQLNQSYNETLNQHQTKITQLYFLNFFSLGASFALLLYMWYYTHK